MTELETIQTRIHQLKSVERMEWAEFCQFQREIVPLTDRLDELRDKWCQTHEKIQRLIKLASEVSFERGISQRTAELCPRNVAEKQETSV